VKSFTGDAGGDDGEVIRQVYAIRDVLVDRDLHCTSLPASAGNAPTVLTQSVKLVDQSLTSRQTSCVDGSVLLASALRKIGLEPFLVMVPGHCYVGFYVEESRDSLLAIETTLLGTQVGKDGSAPSFESLDESVGKELRDPASWPGFSSAVVQATNSIEQHADKFTSPDESDYLLIDISEARAMGIRPLISRGRATLAGEPPVRQ
jgi:hypothetical protein